MESFGQIGIQKPYWLTLLLETLQKIRAHLRKHPGTSVKFHVPSIYF